VLSAIDALNVEEPITIEYRAGAGASPPDTTVVSNAGVYTRQVDAFAEAVEAGGGFPIPGIEGLKNQLVLDALFRSRESGRAEPVQPV
jgi:hypothetical protein